MIRQQLTAALGAAAADIGIDAPADIGLEQPANRSHGDWSSNLAMVCAKSAGSNPRELAERLVTALQARSPAHVDRIEIAGPGFVNFHLAATWLHDVLVETVQAGPDAYGAGSIGAGTHVNIEFVSANPTGPLHVGHGRGAVYGDSLARILRRCGYEVTTETYVNDGGAQMRAYGRSLEARAAGVEPDDDGYHGQYIADWAAEMPADADPIGWGLARGLADHREVLELLDVTFDVWSSEKEVSDRTLDAVLEALRDRGVVYEADGATWLRSTDYGDDKDRVLVKSDGDYTYVTPDIAYHADKLSRSDELIDVLGADHHGYVARMKAALAALGHDPDQLDVRVVQLVKIMRGDEEVRLSKRAGDIVELRDVIEEVGADATRFTFLAQSLDSQQVFDLELAASQAMDNPVFYTQYAHARIASIQRKAAEAGIDRKPLAEVDLGLLTHERELEVLRQVFALWAMIEIAGRERAPHRLAGSLRELAAAFHGFYHDCYVIGTGVDADLTQARLWLVEAARVALVAGLGLLGMTAPDSMWLGEEQV